MARIDTGNTLEGPLQQPGAKLSNDGYGLLTATVVWKANTDNDLSVGNRGSTCPINAACAAHKFGVTYDNLGMVTITVDYVGIDPEVNGGDVTNPNCSGANGLTSQNITAHPNFFTAKAEFGGVIAGSAPYTQDTANNLAPIVNGAPAYLGQNGACFEKANGGRFIGFVNPANPSLYGKTQYLAPTTSLSGVIYMAQEADVTTLVESVGTTSSNAEWGTVTLLPTWAPIGTGDYGNKNLLSQVNVEEYGLLFKVSYEIRFNEEGWDQKVYAALN
jgi:hypothetical protein